MQNNNEQEQSFDSMLQDAISKGCIYYSNTWMARAIQQHCKNMTIGLAMTYNYGIDIGKFIKENSN